MFEINKPKYLNYLLTDILPYEAPLIFNVTNYHDFLLRNKYLSDMHFKYDSIVSSTPLNFESYVNKNKIRTIDLISPVTYVDIALFIKKYEDVITEVIASRNSFSLRYPVRKKTKYRNNSLEKYKKLFGESRENINRSFTRSYFNIKRYKRPYYYTNSKEFYANMRKLKYYMHLDISDCFRSIYSHTLKWTDDSYDFNNKNINKKTFLSSFDRLLQCCNGMKTNGIVVGPEMSRVAAEIILTKIDQNICKELEIKGYIKEYSFKRYIDDYYIFAKTNEIRNEIKNVVIKKLREYNFVLNESKIEYNDGLFTLGSFARSIDSDFNFLDFSREFFERKTLKVLDLAVSSDFDGVLSYYLEVLYKKSYEYLVQLKNVKNPISNDTKSKHTKALNYFDIDEYDSTLDYQDENVDMKRIYFFLDEFFYLVSLSPKHSIYNKLVTLITLFDNIILNLFGECSNKYSEWITTIGNVLEKNSSKILDDIQYSKDMLLVYEKYGISLEIEPIYLSENNIYDNPLLLSVLYRYCNVVGGYSKVMKEIELVVLQKFDDLLKDVDNYKKTTQVFMNEKFWYFILFYNTKMISDDYFQKIEQLMMPVKENRTIEIFILYVKKTRGDNNGNGFANYASLDEILKPYVLINNKDGNTGY